MATPSAMTLAKTSCHSRSRTVSVLWISASKSAEDHASIQIVHARVDPLGRYHARRSDSRAVAGASVSTISRARLRSDSPAWAKAAATRASFVWKW
ncbi:Uncharacterised protein [Mycobacteroides abscessus subsp. abscessus]|nr:Uncharacterised protein [Mycobacteroides abscessus subsp. abscessus]